MKAIICTGYGSPEVLQLEEFSKPTPNDNQILVKICAATVSSGDCVVRSASKYGIMMKLMLGLKRPRQPILGTELSGIVEAVGRNVKNFNLGDQVFVLTGMKMGGYAEYVCISKNGNISMKPINASFEEAAALAFGGTTALHFLRKTSLTKGKKILIYGASGSVGTAAVQLANYWGAEVTGVCSTQNSSLVSSLGATTVIDYTTNAYQTLDKTYDIVFDAVGKMKKADVKRLLTNQGKFASVAKGLVKERVEDLNFLKELVERQKLVATIDRVYPLSQAAEAHHYVDMGHKRGNVVLNISQTE